MKKPLIRERLFYVLRLGKSMAPLLCIYLNANDVAYGHHGRHRRGPH